MSLLRFLGLGVSARNDAAETESVRTIVAALDRLEAEAARRVARFAYVLCRVARADLAVSADETRAMEGIVVEHGHLPEAQAVIVVQIAKSQGLLLGDTDGYLVTRAFANDASRDEKLALLHCCFAVAAADDVVSPEEEAELRQITRELLLGHDDFLEARAAHRQAIPALHRHGRG